MPLAPPASVGTKVRLPLVCSLACTLLTGCAQGYVFDAHGYPHGHMVGMMTSSGRVPIRFLAWVPEEDDDADTGDAPPPASPSLVALRPPLDATPDEPVHHPFDAPRALAALHAVDLSACGERAALRSYGHARITFEPHGSVSGVVLDGPPVLPHDIATCVAERMAAVEVSSFDGGAITVGASYFLR
jgi:hypothetical protein